MIFFLDKLTNRVLYSMKNQSNLCMIVDEGESKKIFKRIHKNHYFDNICLIMLKSTIYSHSKQATGEIESLGAVRGQGTQLYLEMMWRNNLSHCYRSVNLEGLIISDYLTDIPPTEIVGKFNCEGTDKHSYYNIRYDKDICLKSGEYKSGLYTRIDWRNPNHVSVKDGRACTENIYYYVIEEVFGKEKFFEIFLREQKYFKPFGDKTIYTNIITSKINVEQTTKSLIQIMFTIKSYLNKINLDVQDACFMMNKEGKVFWSEINQDCMRIKAIDDSDDKYDKDIWRSGGSSSKELILKKWKIFNEKLRTYLDSNPFSTTEMLSYDEYFYEKLLENTLKSDKFNISPSYKSLYQSLLTKTKIRNTMIEIDDDFQDLIQKFRFFPDILIKVNCVKYGDNNLLNLIEQNYGFVYCTKINMELVKKFIKHSARRLVISHDSELVDFISPKRQIINFKEIWDVDLINSYVTKSDSIMFDKFDKFNFLKLSNKFKKIYIKVNKVEQFIELLKIDKIVPVINSKLIENIPSIYLSMLNMNDDETYNTIIQDKTGNIIDFNKMTEKDFIKTFDRLDLDKVLINDSGNSVIFTINSTTMKTKFNTQSIVKSNILSLHDSIESIYKEADSEKLLTHIIDDFYKISNLNDKPDSQDIEDVSTFLVNYMSYIKSKNISLENILNRINANKWNTFNKDKVTPLKSLYKIGITGEKYSNKTDNYILTNLGIKVNRPQNRSMSISYEIVDKDKYNKFFDKEIVFVPLRPKDMVYQYSNGVIDGYIAYSSITDNYPHILNCVDKIVDSDIKVCLLNKKGHIFNKNIKIAAEHYSYVKDYMKKMDKNYEISHVFGSSETFIINNPDNLYDLCDAVVESGKTIEDNNLEIFATIKEKGEITIGLYF